MNSENRLDRLRPVLAAGTRRVAELILDPAEPGPLAITDRYRIALRVAAVHGSPELADGYRRRLAELGDATAAEVVAGPAELWYQLGDRVAALLGHAEQVALDPVDVESADVAALRALGWDDSAVVAATQVVAYVSYRCRLDRGLAAQVMPAAEPAGSGPDPELPPFLRLLGPDDQEFPQLRWRPWVEPAPVPRQGAGADERTPARWSPFYLTLLHDPAVLAERTALYNAIMTGDGALDRADRELVALATSLVTGCGYCASVHGRRQQQLTGNPDPAAALAARGPEALAEPRHRALVGFAARSAITPPTPDAGTLSGLRGAGLDDAEIGDAIAVAAMFAWANRLMLTLGAPESGVS